MAGEVGAEASALEPATENSFLARVTQSGQPQVRACGPELSEEPPDGLRATDWHDANALLDEIAAPACREGLQRDLVADPFDEHDGARVADSRERQSCRVRTDAFAVAIASRAFVVDRWRSSHRVSPESCHDRAARPANDLWGPLVHSGARVRRGAGVSA